MIPAKPLFNGIILKVYKTQGGVILPKAAGLYKALMGLMALKGLIRFLWALWLSRAFMALWLSRAA